MERLSEVNTVIGPGQSSAIKELARLHRQLHLIWLLMWREIVARYKQSLLGPSLIIIHPLIMTLIFTFVFGTVAKVKTEGVDYIVFAYAGVLPWTFFQRCVSSAGTSLTSYGGLLAKVYFPRIIAPLTAVGIATVDLLASTLVFVVIAALFGVYPTWKWLLLPAIILYGSFVGIALSLWITSLNVTYRDVQHMLPYAIQTLMYLSPVAYPVSEVPESLQDIYALNPLVGYLQFSRWLLLDQDIGSLSAYLISLSAVMVVFVGGLFFFSKTVQTFADRL